MAYVPPVGQTTDPDIFLDNVKRADELVNGPAGTVNDRGGELIYTNGDIRVGSTPASTLPGFNITYFPPGADVSGDERSENWVNSMEVGGTSSGHRFHPKPVAQATRCTPGTALHSLCSDVHRYHCRTWHSSR